MLCENDGVVRNGVIACSIAHRGIYRVVNSGDGQSNLDIRGEREKGTV